uniref:TNFR-Cys domain-containing protein n=1 Tax=Mola mola TaxID=94237 RepID=A0A3Q4BLY0_MOLML
CETGLPLRHALSRLSPLSLHPLASHLSPRRQASFLPGTYLRARCTSTRKSECAPCPSGSFTELWNHIGKCLRCGACGQNQAVKRACAPDSDCQCECKPGYFYRRKYDMCIRHSACPVGQGVLRNGTADRDTECHVCSHDTFSDTMSAQRACVAHRRCQAAGLQLLLRGSKWHDSMCASCQQDRIRDGANYLRDLVPVFFLHQKMPVRRLRHIVHRLPSQDGRRQAASSGLNVSALHDRIGAWVASAASPQIRQLPAILRRAGAHGAGDKLENKLQRMDARLRELCAAGNEVEQV